MVNYLFILSNKHNAAIIDFINFGNGGHNQHLRLLLSSQTPRCPEGSGKMMIDGVCVCPPHTNKVEGAGGNCVCPEGKVENYQGVCVDKPCEGDPVPNPEIAPQTNSGIEGGLHDTCARKNLKYICKEIRGRKCIMV